MTDKTPDPEIVALLIELGQRGIDFQKLPGPGIYEGREITPDEWRILQGATTADLMAATSLLAEALPDGDIKAWMLEQQAEIAEIAARAERRYLEPGDEVTYMDEFDTPSRGTVVTIDGDNITVMWEYLNQVDEEDISGLPPGTAHSGLATHYIGDLMRNVNIDEESDK